MDSSPPITYSITSNSTTGLTADQISTLGNITISNGSSYYYTGSGMNGNSGTITLTNTGNMSGTISSASTVTIGGAGSGYEWNWKTPEEFIDAFPDWDRIQTMCEEYPALKIAFDKFKTTYKLVKDHYDTPKDQRPLP
jgi:hypothetical protein